ncbi:hypothetical protein HK105_202910 [Polyrhizophydium stewartii]|uniref:Uncharacterized protein n=1 Tax=Polyrhizophydium stewartii TaxID=2732419 RepID=A0ABR4NDS8_9FUNG
MPAAHRENRAHIKMSRTALANDPLFSLDMPMVNTASGLTVPVYMATVLKAFASYGATSGAPSPMTRIMILTNSLRIIASHRKVLKRLAPNTPRFSIKPKMQALAVEFESYFQRGVIPAAYTRELIDAVRRIGLEAPLDAHRAAVMPTLRRLDFVRFSAFAFLAQHHVALGNSARISDADYGTMTIELLPELFDHQEAFACPGDTQACIAIVNCIGANLECVKEQYDELPCDKIIAVEDPIPRDSGVVLEQPSDVPATIAEESEVIQEMQAADRPTPAVCIECAAQFAAPDHDLIVGESAASEPGPMQDNVLAQSNGELAQTPAPPAAGAFQVARKWIVRLFSCRRNPSEA